MTGIKVNRITLIVGGIVLYAYEQSRYFVFNTSDFLTYAVIPLLAILFAIFLLYRFYFRDKLNIKPGSAKFITSTIVDDVDSDDYKLKLKEASDLYLQGRIGSEDEVLFNNWRKDAEGRKNLQGDFGNEVKTRKVNYDA